MIHTPQYKTTLYLSDGLLWAVQFSTHTGRDYISYPMCPRQECHIRLDFSSSREAICIKCNSKYTITKDYENLRTEVELKYQGSKTLNYDVINLDLPPTKISHRQEDDDYWVEVRLGQKEGKRMAVVYIGEKAKGKNDYTQLFVDLDDEALRFDKGNKHPIHLLSSLVAYFPKTKIKVESNES